MASSARRSKRGTVTTSDDTVRETRRPRWSAVKELPVLLLVAFVLAFLIRTFLVQVFYIPSGSMEPTLAIDDRIVVEKLSVRFGEPERGDIVVFEQEGDRIEEPSSGAASAVRLVGQFLGVVPANARDYVKRVIGLPGDVVEVRDGQVTVNGEPLDEPYVVHDDRGTFEPVEVPAGRLYVLGDNRPNSSDSRYPSLGLVRVDDVVGRSVATIWPPSNVTGPESASYG